MHDSLPSAEGNNRSLISGEGRCFRGQKSFGSCVQK
ncbi:hypothetical protein V6Z11_1Z021500 [Gossypium hirsutum]